MLACGHDDSAFGPPVCGHILGWREEDPSHAFYNWYTGEALEVEVICAACVEARERGELSLETARVCRDCFEFFLYENGDFLGTRGRTEIRDRPLPFDPSLAASPLPAAWGEIADFAPVDGDRRSLWILLSAGGQLIRFDAGSGEAELLGKTAVPRETHPQPYPGHEPRWRLHVSRRGDAAAVVNDFGRFGEILDLRWGAVLTRALDGGSEVQATVPLSFAFVETAEGRTLAVHRSERNNLELCDPFTGRLLSRGDLPPEQDSKGFHGRLLASPAGNWILEDAWYWQPVGAQRVFSVDAWLKKLGNAPEAAAEGQRDRTYGWRDYYWNGSLAWIDDTRLAIGGLGEDDADIIPGAYIFDRKVDQEVRMFHAGLVAFPGPAGEFFSDGESLFSAGPGGLCRWDLTDGCRTGFLPGFEPSRHHRSAGELAQLSAGRLLRWTIPRKE